MNAESKKERAARLAKAKAAAEALVAAVKNAQDYLNVEWDGPRVVNLAVQAEQAAARLLVEVAHLGTIS